MTAERQGEIEFVVEVHDDDRRLDRFLRERLPELSRGQLFKLLRTGKIRVDGSRAEAGTRLSAGMRVSARRAALGGVEVEPRAVPLVRAGPGLPTDWIVAQDDHLLAIDKPAGLALHPGQGIADHLVDRVHRHWTTLRRADGPSGFMPAPGHRLDRATSGIVLFGLSPLGVRAIAAAFRESRAKKTYLAILSNTPKASVGTIDIPLSSGPAPRGDLPRTYPDPRHGQPALTEYRCLGRNTDGRIVVELCPKTGRNHQLRAHLAAIGCPILGDSRYGGRKAQRLWLHAWKLQLDLPELGSSEARWFVARADQSLQLG